MIRVFYKVVILLMNLLFWSRLAFFVTFLRDTPFDQSFWDWLQFITAAVRFDLMVTGYCLSPFLILAGPVIFFRKLNHFIPRMLKWNLLTAIILLTVISILDMQHFLLFKDRLNSSGFEILQNFSFSPSWPLFVTGALFVFFCYSSVKAIKKIHFEYSLHSGMLSWIFLLFFTGLMIRSSFGEHHLDLRHAEVTKSEHLNRLIIPSAYALDQAIRGRR